MTPFRSLRSLAPRLAPFLVFSSPAAAQDVQDAPDAIIVLGRALPLPQGTQAYGQAVVDRDTLVTAPGGTIESALAIVPGLGQFRRSDSRSANPSAQGLSMRGLGGNASSRTLVLLDAVPQTDPFFGSVPFNLLSTARLGQIRIVRGVSTGAFGAGALAGAVDLRSADASELDGLWAQGEYGGFDSQRIDAGVGARLDTGFAALSGRFARSDGFLTTPLDQQVSATVPARYRNWSVEGRMAALTANGEVQGRFAVLRDDRTLRFAGADSRSAAQDASIRYIGRGPWSLDLVGYVQARDFSNVVISATRLTPVLRQRGTPSLGIGGKAEVRAPQIGPLSVRFGADVRRVAGETREEVLNAVTGAVTLRRRAGGRSLGVGAFVEGDVEHGPLLLTGGVRVDHVRQSAGRLEEAGGNGVVITETAFPARDGVNWTGRIGARYAALDGLDLRTAVYSGVRLPTLNELYRPFAVFPVTTRANAGLKPETVRGAEIGFDAKPMAGLSISATAFASRLDDAIANVTIGTNVRERQNIDAIRTRGVETALRYVRGDWSLRAAYDYVDARVRAAGPLDGQRPAQTPRHNVSAEVAYAPASGPGLAISLRHAGRQFEDDLGVDTLPAATIADVAARWRFASSLTLSLRVENATDARVVTRNSAGSIDLSLPRIWWMGLSYGL